MTGQFLEEFAFGIGHEDRLAAIRAAEEEWNYKTAGLAAAGRTNAEQPVVVTGFHPMRNVQRILVRIV